MKTNQDITEWMVTYLSDLLNLERHQIDVGLTFDNYGLDSLNAAEMVTALGDWLEIELEMAVVYDYPSIDELSKHLALKLIKGDC